MSLAKASTSGGCTVLPGDAAVHALSPTGRGKRPLYPCPDPLQDDEEDEEADLPDDPSDPTLASDDSGSCTIVYHGTGSDACLCSLCCA